MNIRYEIPYYVRVFERFFEDGDGPSHNTLSGIFSRLRYNNAPGNAPGSYMNKSTRVRKAFDFFSTDQDKTCMLINALLQQFRIERIIGDNNPDEQELLKALRDDGWPISNYRVSRDGEYFSLDTYGIGSLEECINRLENAKDDPALQLGTAKDLLEITCKYIIKEVGGTTSKEKFPKLLNEALSLIDKQPRDMPAQYPGEKEARIICQTASKLALQIDELRNLQGTGHGRELPTSIDKPTAFLIAQIAIAISEFMLSEYRNLQTSDKTTTPV